MAYYTLHKEGEARIKMASPSVYNDFPDFKPRSFDSYLEHIIVGFSDMQENKLMTDFTINLSGGKTISVHKMLLYAASDYFRALLCSGMRESCDGVINLDTLSVDAVISAVDYMYGRNITVEWSQIEEFIEVVDTFQLNHLRKQLEEHIASYVFPINAIPCIILADKYVLPVLMRKATAAASLCFVQTCAENDLHYHEILTLLQIKDLKTISEDEKLKAMIEWVLKQEQGRHELFTELVQHIDLGRCSAQYLTLVLETFNKQLRIEKSLYDRINEARGSPSIQGKDIALGNTFLVLGGIATSTGNHRRDICTQITRIDLDKISAVNTDTVLPIILNYRHDLTLSTKFGILTLSYHDNTEGWLLFDPNTRSMDILPLDHNNGVSIPATIGSKLYVIGGESLQMCCLDIHAATKAWANCANLKQGFSYAMVCSIDKYIFLLYC